VENIWRGRILEKEEEEEELRFLQL